MLKRLRISNAPQFLIDSTRMTVYLHGNPGKDPSAASSSFADFFKFIWNQKQLSFWVPIVLVPLVILNSCYLYSFYIREDAAAPALYHLDSSIKSVPETCDLLDGKWIRDSEPPIYTNQTCKFIQPVQNCMKNGKPDKGYLNWKWRPKGCDLPRFDPILFMKIMRNKKLLFFGDSLARNHMQSLLCSLSQVEEPEKVYTRVDRDVKWWFPSYNFTLTILWAPFLVKHVQAQASEPSMLFNLHLDVPHQAWYKSLPEYDIAVFSASQWFFRPCIYYVNNTVIGCNQFSGQNYTQMDYVLALKMALRTALETITGMGFKGPVIFRTVSTEHFEHGTWSTGGTCQREAPFNEHENLDMGWMPTTFNKAQVTEFERIISTSNDSGVKLRLWNVTRAMFMRPDGHPGPYRLFQPFPDGDESKHVQNDCLHWCLPGPIDMWNQLLMEVIKQEFTQ